MSTPPSTPTREELIKEREKILRAEMDAYKELGTYTEFNVQAFERLTELVKAAAKRTSISDDLLRAVVVLTHAYLEDFVRTVASKLLPLADEEVLNKVPLVGSAGDKGKFWLGKLAPQRGKTVDDVIRASVEEHLKRSNFNSATEICSFLEGLGIELDPPEKELLPILDRMIQRRHIIVHRADRTVGEGSAIHELQPIDAEEVANWVLTTARFVSGAVWPLLKSRYGVERLKQFDELEKSILG